MHVMAPHDAPVDSTKSTHAASLLHEASAAALRLPCAPGHALRGDAAGRPARRGRSGARRGGNVEIPADEAAVVPVGGADGAAAANGAKRAAAPGEQLRGAGLAPGFGHAVGD